MSPLRVSCGLTAGSTRFNDEMSTEAFLDQARTYQDMSTSDEVGKLLIFLFTASTPPILIQSCECTNWTSGTERRFDKIMAGDYIKVATDKPA